MNKKDWRSVKSPPRESGYYIVTAFDGHIARTTWMMYQVRAKQWVKTGARAYWKVTHWMPFPAPYVEETGR